MTTGPVLSVHGLRVELRGGDPIVQDVSLSVGRGEILGLVGESGSGKTTIALALLGFARPGARTVAGEIEVAGTRMPLDDERTARRLRGRVVSYVPQDPGSALNPCVRVGQVIGAMLDAHGARGSSGNVDAALGAVELPGGRAFRRRFPHQLSGGQQQRVAIAGALACEPPVVVLDEPTTGLDVVTQARVLGEIVRLRAERGLAMVYVTHDLAVVAQVCDRVAVLYAGRVVEEGPTAAVLAAPRHPYTAGLVESVPDHAEPRRVEAMPGVAVGVGARPPGCAFSPRCPQRVPACDEAVPLLEPLGSGRAVRCIRWAETRVPRQVERSVPRLRVADRSALLAVEGLRAVYGRGRGSVVAVDDVSFELHPGGCVALVGESGSGKTTVARTVAGLHEPSAGCVLLDGVPLAARARNRDRTARRRVQIVFQNPYESLNPRHRVSDAIARPARILRGLSAREAGAEVATLLERVRLSPGLARRFPTELSGGERQRVAIARALAAQPDVIVCDEITSALDVSVQAAVLDLLAVLRDDPGVALLFITHNLGVVAAVADSVLVLEGGRVREQGPVDQVLGDPQDPYTRRLIEAAPRLVAAP